MSKYKVRPFNFKGLLLLALLMVVPAIAGAVTQKEMEQARTIATKAYLRYANDGSGYLDEVNPTTMEELEAVLKTKEKENIKAFKEIPVPTDYKSWNKDQLVEYWAVTAFKTKGLLEKGLGGRIRARSQINKMTIAPPGAEPEPEASPAAAEIVADSVANAANLQNEAEQLAADEEFEENTDVDKAYNYTWVYIMILAILVAIVVALVVYAANVFKKKDNGLMPVAHPHSDKEMQEKLEHYESVLADKDTDIMMLKKKLDNLSNENTGLKQKIEKLEAELASTKRGDVFVAPIQEPLAATEPLKPAQPEPVQPIPLFEEPREKKPNLRSIFLGRANARGIFIRADRTLNVGNSVFLLETTDGYSGSFKVADSPAAWSLALSNPKEYLETACSGHNLDDTVNATKVVTDSSGTAVFEGGCWRVTRKARIHYE